MSAEFVDPSVPIRSHLLGLASDFDVVARRKRRLTALKLELGLFLLKLAPVSPEHSALEPPVLKPVAAVDRVCDHDLVVPEFVAAVLDADVFERKLCASSFRAPVVLVFVHDSDHVDYFRSELG